MHCGINSGLKLAARFEHCTAVHPLSPFISKLRSKAWRVFGIKTLEKERAGALV